MRSRCRPRANADTAIAADEEDVDNAGTTILFGWGGDAIDDEQPAPAATERVAAYRMQRKMREDYQVVIGDAMGLSWVRAATATPTAVAGPHLARLRRVRDERCVFFAAPAAAGVRIDAVRRWIAGVQSRVARHGPLNGPYRSDDVFLWQRLALSVPLYLVGRRGGDARVLAVSMALPRFGVEAHDFDRFGHVYDGALAEDALTDRLRLSLWQFFEVCRRSGRVRVPVLAPRQFLGSMYVAAADGDDTQAQRVQQRQSATEPALRRCWVDAITGACTRHDMVRGFTRVVVTVYDRSGSGGDVWWDLLATAFRRVETSLAVPVVLDCATGPPVTRVLERLHRALPREPMGILVPVDYGAHSVVSGEVAPGWDRLFHTDYGLIPPMEMDLARFGLLLLSHPDVLRVHFPTEEASWGRMVILNSSEHTDDDPFPEGDGLLS